MDPDRLIARMSIESPCTGVCKLDSRGICIGCFRNLKEIAAWTALTELERARVLAALCDRSLTARRSCAEPFDD